MSGRPRRTTRNRDRRHDPQTGWTFRCRLRGEGNDPRDYRVNFGKISRTGFASRYTVSDGIGEIANAISENILKDVSSSEFLNA